ncbi:MAG: ABC transporter permease [Hyphomicrobiales bacterium]|nr:ABC transporter permease [Hyphomicrobiales bacterium]
MLLSAEPSPRPELTPAPSVSLIESGQGPVLAFAGSWTSAEARRAERAARAIAATLPAGHTLTLDLENLAALDTAGAFLIHRLADKLSNASNPIALRGANAAEQSLLVNAAREPAPEVLPRVEPFWLLFLADIGETISETGRDIVGGLEYLGRIVTTLLGVFVAPRRLRPISVVHHIENFALRSVPIIVLINFLVGAIVAQQGIFQLQRFGASAYAVDLIGILVLRELGVLLTAIMVAGRSGSAITAELGSMKMREEIDALQVMGLDPVEVLVIPRLLALIISLPLLTFIADQAAILGGMVVAFIYGGLTPEAYFNRLQEAIGVNTFAVGLIKAPFMALIIGLIATVEGFAVKGSAESLGRQVTNSVVKAIFMVIFLDGLFAVFFAAIHY